MTNQPKRLPTYTRDADGDPIAVVPLARGGDAIVDADVLEDLLQRGVTLNWTFNLSGGGEFAYVRTRTASRNLVTVAREVIGARPREIVRYRNGDRRDLRRRNLYVSSGGRARTALAA
jgi:hypothetical protein